MEGLSCGQQVTAACCGLQQHDRATAQQENQDCSRHQGLWKGPECCKQRCCIKAWWAAELLVFSQK